MNNGIQRMEVTDQEIHQLDYRALCSQTLIFIHLLYADLSLM